MSEAVEAKRDAAKLQKNSGRGKFAKGDAIWYSYVVDYKEANKSFTINLDKWRKICTDAFSVGLQYNPVLKLIIGEKDKVRLAVVEWSRLEELEEKAKMYDELTRNT